METRLLEFEGSKADTLTDILFGGTFDPPHEGHRRIIARVLSSLPQARLWVLPGKAPAGAHGEHKKPGASFEQRLDLCALAFKSELQRFTRLHLDPIENQLPEPNFTVRTLEALQKRQPTARWGLLMGRDQIVSFAAWHRPEEIIRQASLLVIDRERDDDLGPIIENLGKKLGLVPHRLSAKAWSWKDILTEVYWLEGVVSPSASRIIRQDWTQAAADGWIAPEVARYIEEQGLYRPTEA